MANGIVGGMRIGCCGRVRVGEVRRAPAPVAVFTARLLCLDHTFSLQLLNILFAVAKFGQRLGVVFPKQRRAPYLGGRIREAKRTAHRDIFPALGVLHFDDDAMSTQRRTLNQLFCIEDRPTRHVDRVELLHHLVLRLLQRPRLDGRPYLVEFG